MCNVTGKGELANVFPWFSPYLCYGSTCAVEEQAGQHWENVLAGGRYRMQKLGVGGKYRKSPFCIHGFVPPSLGLSSSAAGSDLKHSALMENLEYSVSQRGSLKSVMWIVACFTFPVAACNCFWSFPSAIDCSWSTAIAEFVLLLMSRQLLGSSCACSAEQGSTLMWMAVLRSWAAAVTSWPCGNAIPAAALVRYSSEWACVTWGKVCAEGQACLSCSAQSASFSSTLCLQKFEFFLL